MGGWFDAVADAFKLPRPPRVSWEEAEARIAPMLLSFMSESRRLVQRAHEARASRAAAPSDAAGAARRDRAARSAQAARAAACRWIPQPLPRTARRWQRVAARIDAYERLLRLDKPIGTLLLLWPTLTALWLASGGRPRWLWIIVMTSARC